MKRRFKITLEGETREVDVEEVVDGRVLTPMANVQPVPMVNKPTEAPPLASQPPVPGILGEGVVPSPMQVRVFSVRVQGWRYGEGGRCAHSGSDEDGE